MDKLTESAIENLAVEKLEALGYHSVYGPQIAWDGEFPERENYQDVVLIERLRAAIARINPDIPRFTLEQALKDVLRIATPELGQTNENFHNLLTNGIEVEYRTDDGARGDKVWLLDYEDMSNNEFAVCSQFTVVENNHNKRADLVLFINGLPLVVIELKNAADEKATVQKAYTQLTNYINAIPSLFQYNEILIASDGHDARMGTISSPFNRFMAWKSADGRKEASHLRSQLETMIEGMLNKQTLVNLIRHYIVFEKHKKEDLHTGLTTIETQKKIAAYHQYYAVEKAIKSTINAAGYFGDTSRSLGEGRGEAFGSGKGGVVWHTQGSGKSLSMVFYTSRLVLNLNNPTIVVITDRNDLDGQLFDTFAASTQLLRQKPVQAKDRQDLIKLLKVAAGGIIFTTVQKFFPEDGTNKFPLLSERKNIVVIADEAHRTQYGFEAKTKYIKNEKGEQVGAKVAYGFAKHMHDALPRATFIGFTGTPVSASDRNTVAVFGNHIDVYDIAQAEKDGATVKIYYESRLAKVHLKEDERNSMDGEVSALEEEAGEYITSAKAKTTRLEAIVGHPERLEAIAEDIVTHFEKRQEVLEGKAMIVAMTRRIAVSLYSEIIKLRPAWHNPDNDKGNIKVVMTGDSADPPVFQQHIRTSKLNKAIGDRLKDPGDSLKMVIVVDMWLTGFDAPCLNAMYIDKPMAGHTLMQAIARVNRVYKDKPGGLIVDYIGIASDLKRALSDYTLSGGKGEPALDISKAIKVMIEKLEVVRQMMHGYDYTVYFNAGVSEKMSVILTSEEHILTLEDGKERFIKEVGLLSRAFALSKSMPEAESINEEVSFFQAVKSRLAKFEYTGNGKSNEEIDTAVRQLVDKALVVEGVVDIFQAAGIGKPDLAILSDEFLEEVRGMKHKHLALELLKKILNDEISSRSKYNLVQSKHLSEMLEVAVRKYQNKILTTAEIINEIIGIAKELRASDDRGNKLKLSKDEIAFYDALGENDSAVTILGDEKLRDIARILVDRVRANTTIDWTIKENVKARLKVIIKRVLREYGYPPDKQENAVKLVLEQAELFAGAWSGEIIN